MEGLRVIVDISGSMSALGKPAVVGNALTTLSLLPPEFGNVQLAKHSWNGQMESLLTLLQQDAGMPTFPGKETERSVFFFEGNAVCRSLRYRCPKRFCVAKKIWRRSIGCG